MQTISLEKQTESLMQGVVELKPGGYTALLDLLKKAQSEKRQLRIKLGIDPTSSDLHLGHMVCIQKLRQFQELGHLPVLLIGGYTAQVGDPSGRNEARPPLSKDDVANYAKTYLDQVSRVIDLSQVELVNNADWFDKFTMTDMVKLASKVTVNQMIAKEAFGKRLDAGQPLYAHEIIYPLLQGYDSVEIKADIELGGTDQLFNLMVGRDLQRNYGQEAQLCMTMPLLIGLDGAKKMSKTSQNYIALNDSPQDIFGKTMSIPDELILDYFTLAARASIEKVSSIQARLSSGENPRFIKDELAREIVTIYYSQEEAIKASENFVSLFKNKEIPEDIQEFKLNGNSVLADILVASSLCESKGEAKRLIQGGGVKLDGNKLDNPQMDLNDSIGKVLQAGKRKFVRLV
ncbi:MAG: tyrosine--tRNA ligase [Candidatus Caenarcaniphilales bacterium]|jgi:tyrosyl-tRNA synthetase|nr:tyrosine--tRNA ligase [Candidatus Caenarcaniphilales bacterium]